MADKPTLATPRSSEPHAVSASRSSSAEDRSQEAGIKRPITTKKLNLATFAQLNDAKKWKKLNSLIGAGQGPLRLWKDEVDGQQVLYLRPRTWGQYFYETLFLFPDEQEARCDKVRAAIQVFIRPCLDAQTSTTRLAAAGEKEVISTNLLNSERLAILDRLESRVYNDRIDPTFFGNKPKHVPDKEKDDYKFFQDVRKPYHGITTVPKGLSIANIAPFKVMADVRILTTPTHTLAENYPAPGENASPPELWVSQTKEKHCNRDTLEVYYTGMLNAFGLDKRTIVLEVAGDDNDHWRSAYKAACQWLAECPEISKPSIMLVPLYRIDHFAPSKNSKAHLQGWSALMATKLGMQDVKVQHQASGPPASGLSNTNGSATTQKLGYQSFRCIDDNDNDNGVSTQS
ncbi:MAG: hypothetical protein ACJ8G3_04855 [Burkholderiaceae bacterium]